MQAKMTSFEMKIDHPSLAKTKTQCENACGHEFTHF